MVLTLTRFSAAAVFFSSAAFLSYTTLSSTAVAQQVKFEDEPERPETVMGRSRPELDPLGVRAGSFLIFPSLALTERFDDNIFATETNEKSDLTTILTPEVQVKSDWNNHSLSLRGSGNFGFYKSHTDENYEDFAFGADGRVDVLRDLQGFAGVDYRQLHEQRSSPDDVRGQEPTEYSLFRPTVGVFNRWNRLSVNVDGLLSRYDFDDASTAGGAIINNDDRDRDTYDLLVRFGYEIVPEYEAFVKGRVSQTEYDTSVDDNGFTRDSDGWEIVGGARIDLTGLTYGDVFVGYTQQNYDDSRLGEVGGLSFGGSLTWNVTRLTTVKGGVERSIEETTQSGASSYFLTQIGVTVDHELLRNLILSGTVDVARLDYDGIGREDDLFHAGIGGRYLMNRHLYLTLEYDYQMRDSNAVLSDFDKNVVMLRLEAQL